jgi:hypothetical protein
MSKGEAMMEKMLSFEEWMDEFQCRGLTMQQILDKARQGLIPADRAIEVPPVEQWPSDAMSISIDFMDESDNYIGSVCEDISRPRPQWSPQIGEAVFCLSDEKVPTIYIGKVTGKGSLRESNLMVKTHDGQTGEWTIGALKPFDQSKIGLRWGEI